MNDKMQNFHVCFSYDWEYDGSFIGILTEKASEKNITSYIVNEVNLQLFIKKLQDGEINFEFLFDRASDTSPEFIPINNHAEKFKIPVFESSEKLNWANDKATMHLEFISKGINTPYTIIIPPYKKMEKIFISVSDLARLGRSFIIKPAINSGGGIGVVSGAETLQDILLARQEFQHDKYLLQEMIHPMEQDNRTFWFRGFYSCGIIQCTWWNPVTHIYELLSEDEIHKYELEQLFDIISKIAGICGLKFFSTEIVRNTEQKFIVVDYVNITSDMRLKSQNIDGVPDIIVENIASSIINYIFENIKKN